MGGTPSFLVRAAREKADVEGSVRWSACRRWHSSEVAGVEGVSESSHVHLRGRMRSADGISAPVEAEVDQASYFPKAGEAEAEESEEDDPTAKRPVPVIASRGPDFLSDRRGYEYDDYEEEEERRRRLEDEDSDEDDFWEERKVECVFVDDDSEDEL